MEIRIIAGGQYRWEMYNSMKKALLICLAAFFFNFLFGQEKISLVPYSYQEKIIPKDVNSEYISSLKNEYSNNKSNLVVIEVNPSDINKEEKAQLKIIKLFDENGNLLGISQPINLYDWEVKPMGDDKTVLVIFPAGTTSYADIKFFKLSGNSLIEVNEIERGSYNFTFDIDNNGEKLLVAYTAFEGISELPQLVLYDNMGNEIWSESVDENEFYSVKLAKNYLIASSNGSNKNVGFLYLFNYQGKMLRKFNLNNIIGSYQIECFDDINNHFFAILTSKCIYLFDFNTMQQIKCIEPQNASSKFRTFCFDKSGNIVAITNNEVMLISSANKSLFVNHKLSGHPEIINENEKIILKMWNPEKTNYYEIQYK